MLMMIKHESIFIMFFSDFSIKFYSWVCCCFSWLLLFLLLVCVSFLFNLMGGQWVMPLGSICCPANGWPVSIMTSSWCCISRKCYFLQQLWNQAGYDWWLNGRMDVVNIHLQSFPYIPILEVLKKQWVKFRLACKTKATITYNTPLSP